MRIVNHAALAATLIFMAAPAFGQAYSLETQVTQAPLYTVAPEGASGQPTTRREPLRTAVISLYPLTQFNGSAAAGVGSASRIGFLVAAEKTFGNAPRSFAIGGWYWTAYNSDPQRADLYEVHVKDYFTRQIGVQVGRVGSTSTSGQGFDIFLIGDLGSAHSPWVFEGGVGAFIDSSGGLMTTNGVTAMNVFTTTDVTAFVGGAYNLHGNWTLNASYWYIRDRGSNINRLAVGVGYKLR